MRLQAAVTVGIIGLLVAAVACNIVIGVSPGTPACAENGGGFDGRAPVPTARATDTTVAGPEVTLEWTGGTPPYEVEVAFDKAFTDPVPGLFPITTDQTNIDVTGLPGGFFYWRVRSLGDCGDGPFTDPAELHVTCSPIRITDTPMVNDRAAAIAWNPNDKEYGVTLTRGSPQRIYFARVDRLGRLLLEPTEMTGSSLPPLDGGYQSHSLAYVQATDRWVVIYHREGADQAYLTLFDDSAVAHQTFELYDGFDSEWQSVDYQPDAAMIVTSNDASGAPWTTQVHRFNASLEPMGSATNASRGAREYFDGRRGSILALPGLNVAGHYALAAFEFQQALNPLVHELMLQLVRLEDGAIFWPLGWQHPTTAGKQIVSGVRTPLPMMAWNSSDGMVGLAYVMNNEPLFGLYNDVFFIIVNPLTGDALGPSVHLNAAQSATAALYVKVAWDGEEFLAAWGDASMGPESLDIRLTKLSGLGTVLAQGNHLYEHTGSGNAFSSGPARSIVGHDRIHAMVYSHRDACMSTWDTWLCIEPVYK